MTDELERKLGRNAHRLAKVLKYQALDSDSTIRVLSKVLYYDEVQIAEDIRDLYEYICFLEDQIIPKDE